jgi:predicted transcriptional regulator
LSSINIETEVEIVELTDDEVKVVEALKMLKALSENTLKTADHISKASKLPKGKVSNVLMALLNKGVVKRVAREKAAGYFLAQV